MPFLTKSELSILSEWVVARDRTQNCHEHLILHRQKIHGVEIDLLFGFEDRENHQLGKSLKFFEVKTRHHGFSSEAPLGRHQFLRLLRTAEVLANQYECEVEAYVAVVSHRFERRKSPKVITEISYHELSAEVF